MRCFGRAIVAAISTFAFAGAGGGVAVDVAGLKNPSVAAQAMPELAHRLLAIGVPDPQTRLELLLVARQAGAARALMEGFPAVTAASVESVLSNKGAFGSWQDALQTFQGRTSLGVNEAIRFAAAYAPETAGAAALIGDDQRRRFVIRRVSIPAEGVTLAAIVVRPRGAVQRLPAALEFTIYAQPEDDTVRAAYAAARGYAAVVAYTRGKAWGTGPIVPYEFDGRDANRAISWIAAQPWSDGKVGMYGGSYDGFTQWAAAKFHNPALKTIVPYVANNPGNGLPMENNVFLLVTYAWIYYVTDDKYLDDAAYGAAGLRDLNERWYRSGSAYRAVPAVFGRPNPWLEKWLNHPGFDAYWRSMVPYAADFARIDIPTLTISGYYDDGQGSALNFMKDHAAYDPQAADYLVIGPYDHLGSQHAHKDAALRGYPIDPIAQFSTPKLTFDWFDWILRDGPRPAMLADRMNFEVMGANRWRHAGSFATMSSHRQRYYLAPHTLASRPPASPSYIEETVNFADRKTVNGNDYYPDPILGASPDLSRGLAFESPPLRHAMEIDGFFTGHLVAAIDKRDMDVQAVLYQRLPDGRLMHLSYFMGRASYGDDLITRRLFNPGLPKTIVFDRSRLVSRYLEKGSRLLLTLDVVKSPFSEINYGTGGDVSRENLADAKAPLTVRWSTSSFITLPVRP
ncbi:MAG TPA: CocE/NonD family hydrolase [Candidatus Acidoferrales bacterium]|nr:CocE/NonD family hydrolase [Candidatus Acidoferrales bacterium]